MKKQRYGLFNPEERKKMLMPELAKSEDKYSILDDKSRQEMGMKPRAKFEDNFSLQEEKPNKMKDLLAKLSQQGKTAAKGLGKAADVQAPEASAMSESEAFNPADIKATDKFGKTNIIEPSEFDYQSKLEILKKLMGM